MLIACLLIFNNYYALVVLLASWLLFLPCTISEIAKAIYTSWKNHLALLSKGIISWGFNCNIQINFSFFFSFFFKATPFNFLIPQERDKTTFGRLLQKHLPSVIFKVSPPVIKIVTDFLRTFELHRYTCIWFIRPTEFHSVFL